MPKAIGLYTDLISPFGYLGALGVQDIAAKHGRTIDWRPFLLGITVLKVMGLPPVPETPLKGPYSQHDAPRCFRLMGVPYNPPEDRMMAPLPAGRALTWVKEQDPDLAVQFGLAVAQAHWSEAQSMSTPEAVAGVAETLGIDSNELLAAIETEAVKEKLKLYVDAAIERGVFGAPTFDVDGELFWGHDRLYMVDRWLETGGW